MQSKLKRSRVVTYTIYREDPEYDEDYTVAWEEGQSWARFSGPEFQFTITSAAVDQLKELVDAFLEGVPDAVSTPD
jgi:hypothetical protein